MRNMTLAYFFLLLSLSILFQIQWAEYHNGIISTRRKYMPIDFT